MLGHSLTKSTVLALYWYIVPYIQYPCTSVTVNGDMYIKCTSTYCIILDINRVQVLQIYHNITLHNTLVATLLSSIGVNSLDDLDSLLDTLLFIIRHLLSVLNMLVSNHLSHSVLGAQKGNHENKGENTGDENAHDQRVVVHTGSVDPIIIFDGELGANLGFDSG